LNGGGLPVRVDGRTVLVEVPDEGAYVAIRDAIADLRLALVRLEPRRHRLEDLFQDEAADDAA